MRIELRGSRRLAISLALIGLGAGAGLFLTDLSALVAAPFALAALAWGAVLARSELRQGRRDLVLRGNGRAEIDGLPVDDFAVDWRGALACLSWTAGTRRVRCVAWPDVLEAGVRRELRLWAVRHRAPVLTATVAP